MLNKLEFKEVNEDLLNEYVSLNAQVKELEKRKEELKLSILNGLPNGGNVGEFIVLIENQSRRSFPIDDVKSKVTDEAFTTFYAPFIKVSESKRLIVKRS